MPVPVISSVLLYPETVSGYNIGESALASLLLYSFAASGFAPASVQNFYASHSNDFQIVYSMRHIEIFSHLQHSSSSAV